MTLPPPLRRLGLDADDRPDLTAIRPHPTIADWRTPGAPGTGRGADVDGSYEPGCLGGPRTGERAAWSDWLFRGKP